MGEQFDGLISKKQLLEKYHISYGALYRWKRKGLIPDDWFIRKTTSTGQETFFPEEKVSERLELILKEKEDVLLDELSQKLNEEENSDYFLSINTVFGEKRFSMKDILSLNLTNGKKNVDLTALINRYMEDENV